MRRRLYKCGDTKIVTKFLLLPVTAHTTRDARSPKERRWLERATIRYVLAPDAVGNPASRWQACNFEDGEGLSSLSGRETPRPRDPHPEYDENWRD